MGGHQDGVTTGVLQDEARLGEDRQLDHRKTKDGGYGNPTYSDTMLGIDNLYSIRSQRP
jgi:hypothetical protein